MLKAILAVLSGAVTMQHERPARTISEAKVCLKRWGLANWMPVVLRWCRNSERNPAGVMRAPRAGPFNSLATGTTQNGRTLQLSAHLTF